MWERLDELIAMGATEAQLIELSGLDKLGFRKQFRMRYNTTLAEYRHDYFKSSKRVFIDWDDIRDELEARASVNSIAKKHHLSVVTLSKRCEKDLGMAMGEFAANCQEAGESTLKLLMYEKAKRGDSKMLIWLSKNWLGYADRNETNVTPDVNVIFKRYEEGKV